MKNFSLSIICISIAVSLSGCGLIEGAFKAGVIFALIIVLIIGLVIWLTRMVTPLILRALNPQTQKSNNNSI